jgi:hypothetical protein
VETGKVSNKAVKSRPKKETYMVTPGRDSKHEESASTTTGEIRTLGVDGSQIGVFKQGYEVRLGSLLQCHHGGGLEAQIRLANASMPSTCRCNDRNVWDMP